MDIPIRQKTNARASSRWEDRAAAAVPTRNRGSGSGGGGSSGRGRKVRGQESVAAAAFFLFLDTTAGPFSTVFGLTPSGGYARALYERIQ